MPNGKKKKWPKRATQERKKELRLSRERSKQAV